MVTHVTIMIFFYTSVLLMLYNMIYFLGLDTQDQVQLSQQSKIYLHLILWRISEPILYTSTFMNVLMVYYICWSFSNFAQQTVFNVDSNDHLTISTAVGNQDMMENSTSSLQSEGIEENNRLTYSDMRLNQDVIDLVGHRSDKLDFSAQLLDLYGSKILRKP